MTENRKSQIANRKCKRRRGPGGRFVTHRSSLVTRHSNDDFAALAAELKAVAALDSQLEEHFDIEKYPRVKAALDKAVSQQVEDIIKQRFAAMEGRPVQKDYRYVTLTQLIELTGVVRRTPYDWLKKGLPREANGTFFLPTFIKWFEKYTIEKLPAKVIEEINPFQAEKAKRLRIDIAEREHRLLDRSSIMAGIIARHQNLINALKHKAEELARDVTGQPQTKIMKMLNDFFDGVLRQQCSIPEQLRLPEEKAKQFSELLNNLTTD